MRFKNLHIEKLPGIRPGFSLEAIGSGVNLVVGPNASGKTSLCRAVRALLYADEQPDSFVQLEAEVEDENGTARVSRIGREIVAFGRVRPLEERIDAIRAVTADDIQRVVRTYLQPESRSVIHIIAATTDENSAVGGTQ